MDEPPYGDRRLRTGMRGALRGHDLTARERQVMAAVVLHGHRDRAAVSLGISIQTIKNHLTTIYAKTGTLNLAQALWKLGFIDLDELVK